MKNEKIHLVVLATVASISLAAVAADPSVCPPMPSALTAVSQDVTHVVNNSASDIFKGTTNSTSKTTITSASAIFSKFPNLDRMLALQMLASTYCSMIVSSDLSSHEKLAKWNAFQSNYLRAAPAGASANPSKGKPRSPQKPSSTSTTVSPATNPSSYDSALVQLRAGNVQEARDLLTKLANDGDGRAAYQLGKLSLTSETASSQFQKTEAFRWFLRSANAGVPEGQYNLGIAYQDGYGTEKDPVLSCMWLKQAARQGVPESQATLSQNPGCN